MDPCDACGHLHDGDRSRLPQDLRAGAAAVAAQLRERDVDELRIRPAPDTWSPLEYGCHVRDVLRVQRDRLALALAEDCPRYEPMGRDERVVALRYNEQDPVAVADEVAEAGDALADAFAALDDDGWARTAIYRYPTRERRTMEWLARHTRHELQHHLVDLRR